MPAVVEFWNLHANSLGLDIIVVLWDPNLIFQLFLAIHFMVSNIKVVVGISRVMLQSAIKRDV